MQSKKIPNPTDKHVGQRIRMRRMMLGISQEKLGDGLDLTFQQVQKYEKGTNRVGASRLQQIARLLNVPESFFFEGAPGGTGTKLESPPLLNDFMTTPGAIALAKAFVELNPKVRHDVVTLVQNLAASNRRQAKAA